MLKTTKILPVLGIWDKTVVTFVHQNGTFGNRENDWRKKHMKSGHWKLVASNSRFHMQFGYFGGPNSFLPSVFWSCNTRKVLNRKGRTISGTPEKQKHKEGRTQKEPKKNAANFALPLSTFLPSVFAFPAWRKSSYPSGLEHFVSWTIKKLKEGRNLGLQNSKISY